MIKFFKRLLLGLAALFVLAALLLAGAGLWFRQAMRGSLPQLDGTASLPGLSAPVNIVRDAQGVPSLTGTNRNDIARALGYLHAQDRFFQMDLLRRRSAGELAELFEAAALPIDKSARLHGFRRTAARIVSTLPAADRAMLDAYTAGVNAGLDSLAQKPWEYLVLRLEPAAWRPEDSLLCIYSMWFDLQDSSGGYERNLQALREGLGAEAFAFFAPLGDSHDAALDGSVTPAPPLPNLQLNPGHPPTIASLGQVEADLLPGSNSFAIGGAHTQTGAGLLANDMHLGLSVPHIWYRAVYSWTDANGPHRLAGITLPGMPAIVAGSNGHIAWGFTNSYVDTTDVILAETDSIAQNQYRTPHGYVDFEERTETIAVKGAPSVTLTTRWSEWGPVIAGPESGRYLVLNWTAHYPDATNFRLQALENATTAAQAVELSHAAGMPNQNLLVADDTGHVAWTVTGLIPRRTGFDGRLPVSWAYGDRHWDGWLPSADTPSVTDPADGILWTANNRIVGGAALAKLGDGGYDDGARAGAIRDDLRALTAGGKKAAPVDLLAIQLDDRARFMDRWQKLLLKVLSDGAVSQKATRGELRTLVQAWDGHASLPAAYRLIRAFRMHVHERVLAPFAESPTARWDNFSFGRLHTEDAVWRLLTEQPARFLDPAQSSWDALVLTAADDVIADAAKEHTTLASFTWGARNALQMQHPFSRFLPAFLAEYLNMPVVQLPGDSRMPRVQGARFGASERMVVSPGHETEGILELPGGQSGHPLSPFYRAGHDAWVKGEPSPFLPGTAAHTLLLNPGASTSSRP